jgi:hypothetical protein
VLQGALDESLRKEMSEIDKAYPIGQCPLHPTIQCYVHVATSLHFNVDNIKGRLRKIAWAMEIVIMHNHMFE